MKLLNQAGVPATMRVGSTGDVEMLCIIASKATYRATPAGLRLITDDEAWPVFEEPFVCAGVRFPAELDFRKRGIDLVVIGDAVAPGGQPVRALTVAVECGRLGHRLTVYGDRWWQDIGGGELAATEPLPFTTMPLSNDRAFGGTAHWEDAPLAHAVNPKGRGFYLSREEAANQPLPNLEAQQVPIRRWTDQPEPAGLYKPTGMSTAALQDERLPSDPVQRGVAMAARALSASLNPAVPELVARSATDLGSEILLTGFTTDGPVSLPVPPLTGPVARAVVGSLRARIPSRLSTLVAIPGSRAVIATYLAIFRYLFRPHEARSVELHWADAPEPVAAPTGQDVRRAAATAGSEAR